MKSSPQARRCWRDAGDVGGGVLDADDVLQLLPAAGERRHLDVDDGAHRHVVDDDGDVDGIVDGLEVAEEALLGRLVVIAGGVQHGVRAHRLGVAGEIDRLRGGVGAGARDHRHALAGDLHAQLHHALVLLVAERRALARGPHGHQPVRALGDLPLDQAPERLLVERAAAERRDERRKRTPEPCLHWGLLPIPCSRPGLFNQNRTLPLRLVWGYAS